MRPRQIRAVADTPAVLPENAPAFRRALLRWFRRFGRDLPWRRTRDPYAILVSELMLQQTTVAAVIPYFTRWMARFPDVAALAAAAESDVLHAWQGLGYYARARHLHAAAQQIARDGWPDELGTLPGVGRYTENAVATFAFDRALPIVEANIARLLARLTDYHLPIDTAAGREHLWSTAAALLPSRKAGAYNSALMDLGATICVPHQPRCAHCPVEKFCRATVPENLPLKKKRTALRRLTEHHAFHLKRGRILLEQSTVRWRGLWILPRLAPHESENHLLYTADFPFTHHRITLCVHAAAPAPQPAHRWFALQAVDSLPLPSPHRRALAHLLARR